ncbi:MAG: energy transducer TonB, partial [Prevotella sp.]|nr:energy transducer TonB [Prevotella sp.]
ASSGVTVGEPQSKFTITLQKDGSDEAAEKAYDVIEQMPQFPGGQAAMRQFLSENLRYPEEAFTNNVQGRVIVNFFVDKDGSVTDARVVHSSNPLLDAEALRVVSSMPNWTPGMQKGKPVRVRYTVPVSFRLEGGDSKPKAPEMGNIDDNIVVFLDGTQVTGKQLKLVNPNDILSITVDKEHGAPAIIVTTKKAHYKGSVTYQEQNQ